MENISNQSVMMGGVETASIVCRLCSGSASYAYSFKLMDKYDARYYICDSCGALQTESPYWLDEAYSNSNLAILDTGAVQRNLNNMAAVYAWVKLTGSKSVVDNGGGDGLLCRLLRDYNVNAFVKDRYAVNSYARGFNEFNGSSPTVSTAFEVLEHFPNPAENLVEIFGYEPESVVVSTILYEGQDASWWYMAPESGQHVFFYTKRSMIYIAEKFGYTVFFFGNYSVFSKKKLSPSKAVLARLAMGKVGVRILRSLMMLMPARGAGQDFDAITNSNLV